MIWASNLCMLDPLDWVDGSECTDEDVVFQLSPIMCSFCDFSNVALSFVDSVVNARGSLIFVIPFVECLPQLLSLHMMT